MDLFPKRPWVEYRGELGKWVTRLSPSGALGTVYLPAGTYRVLLCGYDSASVVQDHFVLPPAGARLDETAAILKKKIVFLHPDGRPARDITLSGQLNARKVGVIWGGYLAPEKGRVVLRGNPGAVWEIYVKGKGSPGQKALYHYTLLPGEKPVSEVRLPW